MIETVNISGIFHCLLGNLLSVSVELSVAFYGHVTLCDFSCGKSPSVLNDVGKLGY